MSIDTLISAQTYYAVRRGAMAVIAIVLSLLAASDLWKRHQSERCRQDRARVDSAPYRDAFPPMRNTMARRRLRERGMPRAMFLALAILFALATLGMQLFYRFDHLR